MKFSRIILIFICFIFQNCTKEVVVNNGGPEIWSKEKANEWYKNQKWLVGSNYIPSNAINQLEMWQAATFDTTTIEKEFVLAESLGMNTMRVFLHDLLHQQDSIGFYNRIDVFLKIASRHKIKPMFVFFDSCWDPFPVAGKQRDPKPFVHNSGWVQSPGQNALKDSAQYARLEKYVKGVVANFAHDSRILAWDMWNEPDNMTDPAYRNVEIPNKLDYVMPLVKKSFSWARQAHPDQPLTSAVWFGNWSSDAVMTQIERLQIEHSDIISFHRYAPPQDLERDILSLQRYGRPILCTEFMARPIGSTFQGCLPVGKKFNVAMYNWGFVSGKTQTIFPWDSWTRTYTSEPPLWFHDIFNKDGTPYKVEETEFIRNILKS
jgi:hypothetical protein